MLTIFSIPKKFEGHFAVIQRNAVKSWTFIKPKPQIILFGDDYGTGDICKEFKLIHVPEIKRNEYGTPLLDDVFSKTQKLALYENMAFIMADIIFKSNPTRVIKKVKSQFSKFLMVGQRYEADIKTPINIKDIKLEKLKLKAPSWMDYFIFSKGMFRNIPPFAVGRTFWDKWMVWDTLSRNIPVIDCTEAITAIHQSHDYSHAINDKRGVWEGEEARENIRLAGSWPHGKNTANSTYHIKNGNILKMNPKLSLISILLKFPKEAASKYHLFDTLLFKTRRILNRI